MHNSQEANSVSPRTTHEYYQQEFDYEHKETQDRPLVQPTKKKENSGERKPKDYHISPNSSSINRPFPCHYCDRRFRQMSHVQQHERLHTGERPYVCLKCDKTFIQLNNLQAHFKRAHTEVLNRGDFCRICCQFFHSEAELISHQNQSHNSSGGRPRIKERFMCENCHKDYTSEACYTKHKKFCCSNANGVGSSSSSNNISNNSTNSTLNSSSTDLISSNLNLNHHHLQQQSHHQLSATSTLVASESFSSSVLSSSALLSNHQHVTTNGLSVIPHCQTLLSLAAGSNSQSLLHPPTHQLLMKNETMNFASNHMLLNGDQMNSTSHLNQQQNSLINTITTSNDDNNNSNNNSNLFLTASLNAPGILMGSNIMNNSINTTNGIAINKPNNSIPDSHLMLQVNNPGNFLGKEFFLRHHLQKVQHEIHSALNNSGGVGNSLDNSTSMANNLPSPNNVNENCATNYQKLIEQHDVKAKIENILHKN